MACVTFERSPQAFLHFSDTPAKSEYWLDNSSASKIVTSLLVWSEYPTPADVASAASMPSLALLIL